jgi:hypothetical protein
MSVSEWSRSRKRLGTPGSGQKPRSFYIFSWRSLRPYVTSLFQARAARFSVQARLQSRPWISTFSPEVQPASRDFFLAFLASWRAVYTGCA